MRDFHFLSLTALMGLLVFPNVNGQTAAAPPVIRDWSTYQRQVEQDSNQALVALHQVIADLVLDIRYATKDNFTGQVIYPRAAAYARLPVARALSRVQDSLAHHGLGLVIWDAYRPYAATVRFFEVYPDTHFVADPRYGSRHNRGCAVDVTLRDRHSSNPLEMPTDYDDFSEAAHPDYPNVSEEIARRRALLIGVMDAFGFSPYPTEWWHFDYRGWEQFPLMDLTFEALEALE